MLLNSILLMAPQGEGDNSTFIIMMVLMVVVFYFFMIRPQMKKSKEQKNFREGLKKGDRVITIGGIHGKVLEVKETTMIIETEGQGRLKIEKSAANADSSSMLNEQQK
ncbi:MAG: preprotein translocase subunit YajC [Bacteroidales bacterium]|nr:preprotein translocase subunit YajC [Bacteroidales bacterium]